MKRYLRRALIGTALVIILVMLAGAVTAFAGMSVNAAQERLSSLLDATQAYITTYDSAADGDYSNEKAVAKLMASAGARVTLIDLSGDVLYDSESSGPFENHSQREEFRAALKGDTGFSQRMSATIGSRMIYCARKIGACVFRFSSQSTSAYAVLYEMLPLMTALAALLVISATVFANRFSARFSQSIEALGDMLESGQPVSVNTFGELQPVLQGIACRIAKLQTDMQEVRRTERMRTDFVANASHELKSPLTSIKGFAELMSVGCVTDPKKQQEYLDRIATESDRMLGVINDILYLSRLEGDQHEAEEPIELAPLALEVKKSLDQLAGARDIAIEVTGAGRIFGAPREIWTLLYNLVDNAIRYGVDGGWVRVRVDDGLIEVSDNGIGMDEAAQSRVFERFYRVDPSRSRKSGGTGLGLSIVKHIVLNNGGAITLKSEPGAGSTFTCRMKKAQ